MSRSVIRPTTLPLSDTGTAPVSTCFIILATALMLSVGLAVTTWAVMASLTIIGSSRV